MLSQVLFSRLNFGMPRWSDRRRDLIRALLAERAMTSLIEREMLEITPDLQEVATAMGLLIVDRGHVATSADDTFRAERAIASDGRKVWLVTQPFDEAAFVSEAQAANTAIAQARTAACARAERMASTRDTGLPDVVPSRA